MAKLNFNANDVSPAGNFEPLPSDWYNATITASETKPTADKDNDNAYLELILTVADGDYVNRKLFARLNLQNNNPVAVEIAQGQLSAICHAIGVMQVEDSSQLHGKPLQVKVVHVAAVKNADESIKYEAKNDVKGFRAIDGAAPAAATASDNTPNWAKETPSDTAAPPPAAALPPTPASTEPVMTEKANGIAYEEYIKQGWTDDMLIEHGYMVKETAAPPVPQTPPVPGPPPASASGDDGKPPWAT